MKFNGIYFPDEMTYNEVVEAITNRLTDLQLEFMGSLSEAQQKRLNKNPIGATWFLEAHFSLGISKEYDRLVEAYQEYTGKNWFENY